MCVNILKNYASCSFKREVQFCEAYSYTRILCESFVTGSGESSIKVCLISRN